MKLEDIKVGTRVCFYVFERHVGTVEEINKSGIVIVNCGEGDVRWELNPKALRRLVKKPKREFWVRRCVLTDHEETNMLYKPAPECSECRVMWVREVLKGPKQQVNGRSKP